MATDAAASTQDAILRAAFAVLKSKGYDHFHMRAVAEAAEVNLSLIHYHFGGKDDLCLAVLEWVNSQLLDRQRSMYDSPVSLTAKWDEACHFLDIDLASGYVRVMMELAAVGYSNPRIAKAVADQWLRWWRLLEEFCSEAVARLGATERLEAIGLPPRVLAALTCFTFLGIEIFMLLGVPEEQGHMRESLMTVRRLLHRLESDTKGEQP